MKKTIGIIVVLIITLIILTGCSVNVNYEVKVNKDGSGDISYVYGFSKDTLESLQTSAEDLVASMKEQAENSEYKTEYYEDDEIAGFKASKHLNDLSKEFSLKEAFGKEYVNEDEGKTGIKINKSLFKTKIIQESQIDLTSMKDIQAAVKMKYTVKLPVKLKTNNATQVEKDGKTATWELIPGEVNSVEYVASGINLLPILIIILVVCLVVAALVYYFIFFKKKKVTK